MTTLRALTNGAYGECGIEKIELPTFLTYLGKNAFYNCTALAEVHINPVLSKIDIFTFSRCNSLAKIVSHAAVPPALESSAFDNSTYNNALLYIPVGSSDAYKNADNWKKFFSYIEDESADIEGVEQESGHKIYYDLKGNITDNPTRGIYIIDGKKIYKR